MHVGVCIPVRAVCSSVCACVCDSLSLSVCVYVLCTCLCERRCKREREEGSVFFMTTCMPAALVTMNTFPPADAGEMVEATFNRRYVMQKLEYGRGRVWQDVQQKVKTYVLATDLSHFKLEQFIHVLDLINRYLPSARLPALSIAIPVLSIAIPVLSIAISVLSVAIPGLSIAILVLSVAIPVLSIVTVSFPLSSLSFPLPYL